PYCSFHFFLLLIPRPPFSPLFPYTTLFRSVSAISFPIWAWRRVWLDSSPAFPRGREIEKTSAVRQVCERLNACSFARCGAPPSRSEEHTSELQSLRHLVCRLLLEKKKV